ncbi:MAG: helix-turn-helix domain-containing protein [Pseudomonas sp.]
MPTDAELPAPNLIRIGRHSLIVSAECLPTGFNQRPGVTLLLAREQPLHVQIEGAADVHGLALLLAPEVKRRFITPQRHFSITIEPGHPSYCSFLHWARNTPGTLATAPSAAVLATLAGLDSQAAFDDWLQALLEAYQQPRLASSERLEYLLELLAASDLDSRAEHLWQSFRARYPSSQAHCSHWLQDCIGLSLRKLLLWRKLRRALEALVEQRQATQIAHAVGFADSAHLSRICSRTFGLRPSQAGDHKTLQASLLREP